MAITHSRTQRHIIMGPLCVIPPQLVFFNLPFLSSLLPTLLFGYFRWTILSLWAVCLDVEQSSPASITFSGLIQSLTFVGIPSLSLTVKETMLLSKSGLRISCHGRQFRIKNSYNSKRGFFEHQMYKWVWQHNVGLSFLQLHFQWCKLHHIIWLQLFRLPYSSSSEHINCYEFNCSIHGDPRKVYFFITTNK